MKALDELSIASSYFYSIFFRKKTEVKCSIFKTNIHHKYSSRVIIMIMVFSNWLITDSNFDLKI